MTRSSGCRSSPSTSPSRLKLDAAGREKIARAVSLCKTDLMTAVVFEFPSLQGKIGRIYALEDGEDAGGRRRHRGPLQAALQRRAAAAEP